MSALQRTILSTVELGVKPVFIVSEHDSSLTYFSLLLSNHLLPKGEAYIERALMPHDNYFNTPYLNHLIQHDLNETNYYLFHPSTVPNPMLSLRYLHQTLLDTAFPNLILH